MTEYYKISKEELLMLLSERLELEALQSYGVDNWSYYGANFEECIAEYGSDCEDFEDCAKILLKDYQKVE